MERKIITDAYVRVCKDSGFQLEAVRASQITASMLGIHPLDVLGALGTMQALEQVADGTHPVCK